MRWTTSVIVLTGLGATVAALALPFQPPSASLLVLNKGDQSLAIVDASTLSVVGRVPTGPDPHEVAVSPDGTRAYVSNYTAGNGADHTISVIDLQEAKALAPIDLGALDRPHGVEFSGNDLYFTAEGSKVVGRYDPSAGKVDWVMARARTGRTWSSWRRAGASSSPRTCPPAACRSSIARAVDAADGDEAAVAAPATGT